MLKKKMILLGLLATLWTGSNLEGHCQMPCGIYHDDMVFDQIDQYVETMYKGMTVVNDSKFSTVKERNETIRWICLKENASDAASEIMTTYFLQQKIKPGEADTAKKLESAHKLLFLIVGIKQNTDRQMVLNFSDEWEKFKDMFHVEGYSCKMEKLKEEKKKKATQPHTHDDGDDHDHTH